MSNNSLFVNQLVEDVSLKLRACDMTYFTNDTHKVNNYSTIQVRAVVFLKYFTIPSASNHVPNIRYKVEIHKWIYNAD